MYLELYRKETDINKFFSILLAKVPIIKVEAFSNDNLFCKFNLKNRDQIRESIKQYN